MFFPFSFLSLFSPIGSNFQEEEGGGQSGSEKFEGAGGVGIDGVGRWGRRRRRMGVASDLLRLEEEELEEDPALGACPRKETPG